MTEEKNAAEAQAEDAAPAPKIKAMRRQPCPCGSGKVFKNCHEGDPGYEVATDAAQAAHAPPPKAGAGPKKPAHPGFGQQHQKGGPPQRVGGGTTHRQRKV